MRNSLRPFEEIKNPNFYQLEKWWRSFQPKTRGDRMNILSFQREGLQLIYGAFIFHSGRTLEIKLNDSEKIREVFCEPKGWGYDKKALVMVDSPLNTNDSHQVINKIIYPTDQAVIDFYKSLGGLEINTREKQGGEMTILEQNHKTSNYDLDPIHLKVSSGIRNGAEREELKLTRTSSASKESLKWKIRVRGHAGYEIDPSSYRE